MKKIIKKYNIFITLHILWCHKSINGKTEIHVVDKLKLALVKKISIIIFRKFTIVKKKIQQKGKTFIIAEIDKLMMKFRIYIHL